MKAMVFAAGRGERMRPLTDTLPKPLLSVYGKPLIDWHLLKLHNAGILDIVINVSYLSETIMNHVGSGARFGLNVNYSLEPEALESGGGLATAAPLLGSGPIAVVSADIYSDIDYQELARIGATLEHNRAHWWLVPQRPGALGGEFSLLDGRVIPANDDAMTLANIGLVHSSLLQDWPHHQKFRLLPHYQNWVVNDWVGGSVHAGTWENVTSSLDLARLQQNI